MITGAILGAFIVLLAIIAIYLYGANRTLRGQVKAMAVDVASGEIRLKGATAQLEDLKAMLVAKQQQPLVHFTHEQIIQMAYQIGEAVRVLLEAKDA